MRVAIRLRPKNAEDLANDTDFIDCIELQPEVFDSCSLLNIEISFTFISFNENLYMVIID